VMNVIGILVGIALNILIAFGSIAIFTIMNLPIHEHGRSFHLKQPSSISFLQGFVVLLVEIIHIPG
jgi:hypothetical protein